MWYINSQNIYSTFICLDPGNHSGWLIVNIFSPCTWTVLLLSIRWRPKKLTQSQMALLYAGLIPLSFLHIYLTDCLNIWLPNQSFAHLSSSVSFFSFVLCLYVAVARWQYRSLPTWTFSDLCCKKMNTWSARIRTPYLVDPSYHTCQTVLTDFVSPFNCRHYCYWMSVD